MPLPLRVVGMSMALPMEDPPHTYTSGVSTYNRLLVLLLPLVVRCLVAFQRYLWSRSTYTTHLVAFSSEQQKVEGATSERSSYQMLKWKTSTWHLVPLVSLVPIPTTSLIRMLSRIWITSPCKMWLAQTSLLLEASQGSKKPPSLPFVYPISPCQPILVLPLGYVQMFLALQILSSLNPVLSWIALIPLPAFRYLLWMEKPQSYDTILPPYSSYTFQPQSTTMRERATKIFYHFHLKLDHILSNKTHVQIICFLHPVDLQSCMFLHSADYLYSFISSFMCKQIFGSDM